MIDGAWLLFRLYLERSGSSVSNRTRAVGVLVRASLPKAMGGAEVDRHPGGDLQLGMLGKIRALAPGQRATQRLGQGAELLGDDVNDGHCSVPDQRRIVLHPCDDAVLGHQGQVHQCRGPGRALH